MPIDAATLQAKAARIRLLLFDVDGVLTDGSIEIRSDGTESQTFHARDGAGIVLAQRAGLLTGILSGRVSAAAAVRAAQLGMQIVEQVTCPKVEAWERILQASGLQPDEVAYMGDDLPDLAVLARAGLSAAPADAAPIVRERVDWVSTLPAGRGAARELLEFVLRAQGRWEALARESEEG